MVKPRLFLIRFFIVWAWSALVSAQSATENNEVIIVTTLNKDEVYVQEELIFSIKLYYTLAFERGASFSRPEMSDAAISRLGESLTYNEVLDGVTYAVNENRFAIFPQDSGNFNIAPIKFRAYTQTRSTRENSDLLTTAQRELIELESNDHQISVMPVPRSFPSPNWLPSTDIEISETWSEPLANIQIGDSIIRTIHIKAEDLFSSMLLNLDFTTNSNLRNYPSPAEQVDIRENQGTRSEHSQNITLVATEAGQLTLPAIEIPWWNTETDSLQYVSLPAQSINVLTAEGLRLEPEPEASLAPENTGFFSSVNLNLILFVGMIILISSLFFAPALVLLGEKTQQSLRKLFGLASNKTNATGDNLKDINTSFNALKAACIKQDIKAVYEHFLDWGQSYFQKTNLYSLDKLDAAFADKKLSALLAGMKNKLYGGTQTDTFDFKEFLQYVSGLHQAHKQKTKEKKLIELPPLYHN